MNTISADKFPNPSNCCSNGGDYVMEGMAGIQQSILGVSTPAA
jgi:hypothetical protein